jgi:hypothetical protein
MGKLRKAGALSRALMRALPFSSAGEWYCSICWWASTETAFSDFD